MRDDNSEKICIFQKKGRDKFWVKYDVYNDIVDVEINEMADSVRKRMGGME